MTELPFHPSFTGLSEQIAIHGRFRAQDTALIEGDRRHSWASYNAIANQIGRALHSAGLEPGMRVAMLTENRIWAHELLLGIWRAGAVAVPLSPMLSSKAMNTMLKDSGATMLCASCCYESLTSASAPENLTVIVESDEFARSVNDFDTSHFGDAPRAEDLAVIIYSSGTTGTPKGIAHTHGSRLAFAAFFAAEFRFHYKSTALSSIPIHSNGAWLSWSPAKWFGATTVILPAFSPDAFFEAVKAYAPTHGFIVPTMAAALLAHPDVESGGLDCFETAITAGSPMAPDIKRALRDLTGNALFELWGLTEGVATIMSPSDMARFPESVGRPMLGCDIRLIDSQDKDVTFREAGEIVGYSAGALSGYWNRDDANRALHWESNDGRHYIRTGDIGEFNSEGFLTLRGRLKDMIVSGGLNVYPVDIEAILIAHEQILDAAVVGVEDPKWGEAPAAFVIVKEDITLDGEAIQDWVNAQLAKHQRVVGVVVRTGDFPRNTLGKVLKQELQREYAKHHGDGP